MLNKTNKKMKKVRAAIVGYGNIGHFVLEALQAAPDFEIAGRCGSSCRCREQTG